MTPMHTEPSRQTTPHATQGLCVALLGDAASIHTVRWANGLHQRGLKIHLISTSSPRNSLAKGVVYHKLPWQTPHGYWLNTRPLRRLLNELRPDLLNAHYATGYGLLARNSSFPVVLLSAWGSDIYEFPAKGGLYKKFLQKNLANATCLAATSNAMAKRMQDIIEKPVLITPFGIDHIHFSPTHKKPDENKPVVIGTIKTLEHIYGIDTLIEAYALVYRRLLKDNPTLAERLRLAIYGNGSCLNSLKDRAISLGIDHCTIFGGYIEHRVVPDILREMSIFVALSRSESFGVAILEASACGLPVVVSNADGPAEVVEHLNTGFIVPRNDAETAAQRLYQLATDPDLRSRMGHAGRCRVEKLYSWEHSLDVMQEAYKITLNAAGRNISAPPLSKPRP